MTGTPVISRMSLICSIPSVPGSIRSSSARWGHLPPPGSSPEYRGENIFWVPPEARCHCCIASLDSTTNSRPLYTCAQRRRHRTAPKPRAKFVQWLNLPAPAPLVVVRPSTDPPANPRRHRPVLPARAAPWWPPPCSVAPALHPPCLPPFHHDFAVVVLAEDAVCVTLCLSRGRRSLLSLVEIPPHRLPPSLSPPFALRAGAGAGKHGRWGWEL